MEQHFSSSEYVKHLANELIRNFSFSSSATTPVLVGSAREKEVIRKLELLLPKSIGVGSGCIIDSYGKTSKQIDIVLYEKDLCPVFCINESSETTYYPCEGVIAAGEVKSSLNSKELTNIFDKAESVKVLKRYSVLEKSGLRGNGHFAFRKYGSRTSFEGAESEDYDQLNKISDQIFCFALCGDLDLTMDALAVRFESELKRVNYINEVNIISILNHGLIFYYDEKANQIEYALKDCDSFFITGKRNYNFEFLLSILQNVINNGRTVNISAYNRYLMMDRSVSLNGGIKRKLTTANMP